MNFAHYYIRYALFGIISEYGPKESSMGSVYAVPFSPHSEQVEWYTHIHLLAISLGILNKMQLYILIVCISVILE